MTGKLVVAEQREKTHFSWLAAKSTIILLRLPNTPQILFFGVVNIAEWGGIHGAQVSKLILRIRPLFAQN